MAIRKPIPIGTRFGKLVTTGDPYRRDDKIVVECACDCGNSSQHAADDLRSGHTKSCGCMKGRRGRKPIPIGQKFGRMVILEEVERRGSNVLVKCRCDCGTLKNTWLNALKRGVVRSCGCYWRERIAESNGKHGMTTKRLEAIERRRSVRPKRFYAIWARMRQRCSNPKAGNYARYGGRGVRVCERWDDFKNFMEDMYLSYLEHVAVHGERNTTIDRIKKGLPSNYEPGNCRWATYKVQSDNREVTGYLEWDGRRQTIPDWAKEMGLGRLTIFKRLKRSWSVEEALTTPPRVTSLNRHLVRR